MRISHVLPSNYQRPYPMKISVIGAGMVGSTYAYRLAVSGQADQIVVTDINTERAQAEVLDIAHALPSECVSASIRAGDFAQTAGSDIIVITAGATMKLGQTRLDLLDANAAIMRSIIDQIASISPAAIVLIASNPLDPTTYAAQHFSGFSPHTVIGSGTILDTNRLKFYLAEKLNCSPVDIQGYVLGEHGDSQVPIYSGVRVHNMSITQYCTHSNTQCSQNDLDLIQQYTTQAAYLVKQGKGATYYGIASALMDITQAIIWDEQRILPVSVAVDGQFGFKNIYCALPAKIGRNGVGQVYMPDMTDVEQDMLKNSMQVIADYCARIDSGVF